MKKKNFICFVLAIVLLFMQNTTAYAAELYNFSSNGTVVCALYEPSYFINKSVDLESNTQYISSTFRPTTNRLEIIFSSNGRDGTYNTFYIEKLNSNGKWTVEYKHVISGGVSRSTSETVIPGELYRIRVTNDNKYYAWVLIEVFELLPIK